jgi:hypothetical protein
MHNTHSTITHMLNKQGLPLGVGHTRRSRARRGEGGKRAPRTQLHAVPGLQI